MAETARTIPLFPNLARSWVQNVDEMADAAQDTISEAIDLLASLQGAADAQACLGRAHDALRAARVEIAELLKLEALDLDESTKQRFRMVPVTREVSRG